PGCNDVVEDGWNGYLVPPHDADGLASRIIDILSDRGRGKIMGGRSVELVREQFALPWVVDQYCDLYKNVLSAKSHGGLARPASSILLEEDAANRGPGGARR
ncbi:MAG: glycosyltransferase family 4 protein, partial [Mesorhizobium sp.]